MIIPTSPRALARRVVLTRELGSLAACAMIVFFGGGCASPPAYNPFKVAKTEIRARVKTIALFPLIIPPGIENPEPIRSQFEMLITSKLEERGFTVIPSKEFEVNWASWPKDADGHLDPASRKWNELRLGAIVVNAVRDARDRLDADGVLFTSIRDLGVPFNGGIAIWYGTSESVRSGRARDPEILLDGGIPAYYLAAELKDCDGHVLYLNFGGLQLKQKLFVQSFIPVPRHELFADRARNQGGVDTALNPLVNSP